MVRMIEEIPEPDYWKILTGYIKQQDYVTDLAIRSGYHPAGYGLYNPSIFKKNDKFYITWERLASCD